MLARFRELELIQLTDDAGTGAIDQARLLKALESASALVEGYVAATYRLADGAPVPLLLVDITCDIARYRLYREAPHDDVTARNAAALRQLESIRRGTIKLDDGVETLTPRDGKVLGQPGERQFSRDQMKGW